MVFILLIPHKIFQLHGVAYHPGTVVEAGSHGQCFSDRGLFYCPSPTLPPVDGISSSRVLVHISWEEPTVRKALTVATRFYNGSGVIGNPMKLKDFMGDQ